MAAQPWTERPGHKAVSGEHQTEYGPEVRHAEAVAGQRAGDRKQGPEGETDDRRQHGPQPQAIQMGHDQIGDACAGKAHRHDSGATDPVRKITADQPAASIGQVERREQNDSLGQGQAAVQPEPGSQDDHAGSGSAGEHPGEPEAPELPAFQGVPDRAPAGRSKRGRRRIVLGKADQNGSSQADDQGCTAGRQGQRFVAPFR